MLSNDNVKGKVWASNHLSPAVAAVSTASFKPTAALKR